MQKLTEKFPDHLYKICMNFNDKFLDTKIFW